MEFTFSVEILIFMVFMIGLAGFVDAIAGGGAIISLPAYIFAGFPVHLAYGTNKFTATSGIIISSIKYFKSGFVEIKIALVAAIGSFIGSALGTQIVLMISATTLKKMLLIILPAIAIIMMFKRDFKDDGDKDLKFTRKKAVLAFIVGVLVALYDALLGPGSTTVAIFAFNSLIGYDLKHSNGNAKILSLSSNIAGLATYMLSGLVYYQIAIPCAIANIIGANLGSRLVIENGAKIVRPVMGLVIIALIGKTVIEFI